MLQIYHFCKNGADLRLNLQIEFEEAVFGVKKEVKISHLETCDECNGTGASKGSQPETCPTCGGTGRVQQVTNTPLGSFRQITTCPKCNGARLEDEVLSVLINKKNIFEVTEMSIKDLIPFFQD